MDINWTEHEPQPLPVWEPLRPPQSHLNYWVHTTDRSFARNFIRILKKTGIIASEWAALRYFYKPMWSSPLEVAAVIGMTQGGASKLVSRLVKKGLVVKKRQYFDRRFRSVGLTSKGRELVVFLASLEKNADREFSTPLGNNRRFRLTQYMKQLHGTHRSQHMRRWVSIQLKNSEFQRFAPVKIKKASKAQVESDALWEYLESLSEAAAHGRPIPPLPAFLEGYDREDNDPV
jgi:DNA-binding MarR family transcriptional regulator